MGEVAEKGRKSEMEVVGLDICVSVCSRIKNPKAVILLARKQIHKYTKNGCECFFCSRVFVCVFDLCGIVLFGSKSVNARIFPTK